LNKSSPWILTALQGVSQIKPHSSYLSVHFIGHITAPSRL